MAQGSGQAGSRRVGDRRSEELVRASELLDRQARLPSMLERGGGGPLRDYAAIAPLAGLTREGYERLDAPSSRRARLAIDRELSARREQRGLGRIDPESAPATARSRTSDGAQGGERGAPPEPLRPERRAEESPVMEDARAVAEGRKRELGFGRP